MMGGEPLLRPKFHPQDSQLQRQERHLCLSAHERPLDEARSDRRLGDARYATSIWRLILSKIESLCRRRSIRFALL